MVGIDQIKSFGAVPATTPEGSVPGVKPAGRSSLTSMPVTVVVVLCLVNVNR